MWRERGGESKGKVYIPKLSLAPSLILMNDLHPWHARANQPPSPNRWRNHTSPTSLTNIMNDRRRSHPISCKLTPVSLTPGKTQPNVPNLDVKVQIPRSNNVMRAGYWIKAASLWELCFDGAVQDAQWRWQRGGGCTTAMMTCRLYDSNDNMKKAPQRQWQRGSTIATIWQRLNNARARSQSAPKVSILNFSCPPCSSSIGDSSPSFTPLEMEVFNVNW